MSYTKWRTVNLPVDQTYQRPLEFVKGPQMRKNYRLKLKDSKEPSYIRVKMEPLIFLNINILSQGGNSQIQFNFNFTNIIAIFVPLTLLLTIFTNNPLSLIILVFIPLSCSSTIRKFMDRVDSFFSGKGLVVERVEAQPT